MDHQEHQKKYDALAQKLLDGTITPEERAAYLEWLDQDDGEPLNIPVDFAGSRQVLEDRMFGRIQASAGEGRAASVVRGKWWRYAAAAVFLLVAGTVIYLLTSSSKPERMVAGRIKPPAGDIAPGGNKATLTLSDGTAISLDDAANGAIAKQGNSSIVKLSNGKLVYDLKGAVGTEAQLNTMSTPRGGQYQLTLQDGTKVWLNAASSITYPASFVGKERKVRVKGEVYFEVAKDKVKPFIVDIDGQSTVEVLGTSFNINAYNDEENSKTTLLEGSVRVERAGSDRGGVVLKPGQQAVSREGRGLSVRSDIDTEEVMAWKDGYFQFNGASLTSVLKQLARWYDVNVDYGAHVPSKTFVGEIPRDATLSQVLAILEKTGVHFRIEERNIVVLP
ncbi:MAG TPA: FecR domain-containing protein [Puia sp.]|nr:FecR domain-containing protein [Puia sp.]